MSLKIFYIKVLNYIQSTYERYRLNELRYIRLDKTRKKS